MRHIVFSLTIQEYANEKFTKTHLNYLLVQKFVSQNLSRQGLTHHDGHIYEGTGLEQHSQIFQHDPKNAMSTINNVPLMPTHLFGEGIASYYVWADDENDPTTKRKEHRLIQLTWKNKRGFIYSLPSLNIIKEFSYDTFTGEGWGVTFIPHRNEFYISDGSQYLSVWDATTLEKKAMKTVTVDRKEVVNGKHMIKSMQRHLINELEFVDFETGGDGSTEDGIGGENVETCINDESSTCSDPSSSPFSPTMRILANIWYQDVIVSINPHTGKVEREYDFTDLYPHEIRDAGADCLNGISITGATNKDGEEGVELWVTGKLWPNMYRVRLLQ